MSGGALGRRATLICLIALVGLAPMLGGFGTAGASQSSTAGTPIDLSNAAGPAAAANDTATATANDSTATRTATTTNTSNTTSTRTSTATATPAPNTTATPGPNETATPNDSVTPTPNGTATPTPNGTETPAANETPSTPPSDTNGTLGREAGVWYNDTLGVYRGDGIDAVELEAIVARTMARVEALRGLEFKAAVPVRLENRSAYRAARANESVNESLRRFDNAKFEALFIVDEATDSITVQRQNAAETVMGYYDPRNDSIVLLTGPDGVSIDEPTLAHELVHALQDQYFGLDSVEADTRDRANGYKGLIEGDATFVERRYESRCAGAWDCLAGGPDTDTSPVNTGVYLVRYQPYSDGPTYVRDAYAAGGWSAVNDLYADPPRSSAEIIHGDEQFVVDSVDLDDETTDDWRRVRPPARPDHAELGEAAIATAFVYPLYASDGAVGIIHPTDFYNQSDGTLSEVDPFDYDQPYSDGWAGDRLHVYENEHNETGYVWRIVWDSPGEAAEFYSGYRQLLAFRDATRVAPDTYRIFDGGFADAFYVSVNRSVVTIVNAPSIGELDGVRRSVPGAAMSVAADQVGPEDAFGETMTVPPDARLDSPTQPGFGPIASVGALALLVFYTRRDAGGE